MPLTVRSFGYSVFQSYKPLLLIPQGPQGFLFQKCNRQFLQLFFLNLKSKRRLPQQTMLLRITPNIWAHIRSDLRSAITGAHHELPEPQVRSFQPTRDFVRRLYTSNS